MSRSNASRLGQNFNILSKHRSVFSEDQKLLSLLKSCTQTSEISQIHGYMIKTSFDQIPFTLSKLLASSIPHIEYAASIFKNIQKPNLFMFNTMLRGCSISDDPEQAFVIFNKLRTTQSLMLDQFSFVTTLKACARELAIWNGQGIHGIILRYGYGLFITVRNTLLQFYCVCGKIEDARKLFDECPQQNDLVSWNTLMGGYLRLSQPTVVTDLFRRMYSMDLEASFDTVVSVLSASGDLGNFLGGQSLHSHCIKMGFSSDLNVVTSLINMYSKCDHIELGRRIFDGVAERDMILWNCMIDRYAKNGLVEEALALLHQLKLEGKKPNSSTISGFLSASATSGSISIGRSINNYIQQEGLKIDAILGTTLITMYSKCGFLENAICTFDKIRNKDVNTWTAMINCYGFHGLTNKAIEIFNRMEAENFCPNEITFLAVLSACSHGGLVSEGLSCFDKMVHKYGLLPKIEHYGCVIDLLGRAGLLEEARKLIENLPIKSDATAWRALLAACRIYEDVAMGESVRRVLIENYDEHPSDLMLFLSTYAVAGRLEDYTRMKEEVVGSGRMDEENMVKEAGCSTIEMDY